MALYFVKLLEVFIAPRQLFWRIDVLKKRFFRVPNTGHLSKIKFTPLRFEPDKITNNWMVTCFHLRQVKQARTQTERGDERMKWQINL